MATPLTQDNRPIQTVVTPLGPNDLIPLKVTGEESVSEPYCLTVDFVSNDGAIKASAVLGKPLALRIAMEGGRERFFHGIVSRFASRGRTNDFAYYRAEIVPSLWLHKRITDCRTFEEKTVLEIVEAVLKEKGIVSELSLKVTAQPPKLPYVVQYRETNLDFVDRLLEDAGLYYYHRHTRDAHTLVISDAHAGAIPELAVPEVKVSHALTASAVEVDAISELEREYAVHSADVSVRDHDLLRADSVGSANSQMPGAKGELYEFLGDLGPNDSANEAKRRIEIEEAGHDQLDGQGTCAAFEPGSRVKVTGGLLGSAGAELLILSVEHEATNGDVVGNGTMRASYRNTFTCIPSATRYRPPRETEWPSVQGTQVAKVVGSGNAADIDVDANGCVLLQFPWDRGAGKDGKSKHRVHVASVWGGAGWGFVQHPRIGQEVLVEFLEGDPDRPIITGRVYNSTHKYPYALPGNKTQSGWKSRTVGGGTDNFNELRFEDKKGEEHVYLQAEKDLKTYVKNNETRTVGNDRTTTIQHDDLKTVKKGNDWVKVEEGEQWTEVKKNNYYLDVLEGSHNTWVKASVIFDVEEGDRYVKLHKGSEVFTIAEGDQTIDIDKGSSTTKVAKKVTIDAGDELTLKCGQSSLVMKKDGTITIKGKDITLDAMAKVVVKASAQVEIKGAKLTAEGQAQTEIKGAMLKLEGQAMTTLKGAIAQVTGDGMLKAGGGISMFG